MWAVGTHKSDRGNHIAHTLLGEYSIRHVYGAGLTLWFGEQRLWIKPSDAREGFKTSEAAKAAAQADYERRILAALEE